VLPLRELQLRFCAAVFDDALDAVTPWIHGDEIDAEARVSIYRHNVHEGFTKTLALEFPVIERLVGEDYFRQLALLLLAEHPSRAGNLHHIGAPFSLFLRRRFEGTPYSYLSDVAALEWAYQESMVAAEVPPLDLDTLRSVAPHAYEQLRFALHPACVLVRSAYPIVRIWTTNQQNVGNEEVIELSSGADLVLVRRADDAIEFRRLSVGDFTLLGALARDTALGDALEAARALDPDFNLGAALRRFIALGVLTGVRISASTSAAESTSAEGAPQ